MPHVAANPGMRVTCIRESLTGPRGALIGGHDETVADVDKKPPAWILTQLLSLFLHGTSRLLPSGALRSGGRWMDVSNCF